MNQIAENNEVLRHRIESLEKALRILRVSLAGVVLALAVVLLSAWRSTGEVKAERLLLSGEDGEALIALRGVGTPSSPALRLETADGQQLLLLGPSIRRLR